MSLPIKSSTILASKLLGMLSVTYIEAAFVLFPASIVYFIRAGNLSWTYFLMLAIGFIFVPMIPLVVASILAVLITYISSRFKYKNLITIIFSMVFFLLIMLISFKTQDFINSFVRNSESIAEGISKVYIPALYLKKALIEFNIFYLIQFIAISLIPFVVFILIFSKTFRGINGKLGESYKKANYKIGELNLNSEMKALTMMEVRKYFSIPIYVLNTAFGMILMLVGAVFSFFVKPENLAMIVEIPNSQNILPIGLLVATFFVIGLAPTTSSSISLEGKNLWIIKSLPIDVKKIFKAKIYLNLLVTVPIAVISNVLLFISLSLNIKYLIFNIFILIMYAIVSAMVGLLINLYFPKLQWTSATTVVKQSASVLLSMVFTLIFIATVVCVIIFTYKNTLLFLLIILILLILLIIILRGVLNSKGKEIFKNL